MKLTQLIEAEADLIKAAAKDRLKSELEATASYRVAPFDLEQEIGIDEARKILESKGYSGSSIDSLLKRYDCQPQEGLGITLNRAVEIVKYYSPEEKNKRELKTLKKEAKSLYHGMRATRRFMLKYIKGSDAELKFQSKFEGDYVEVTVTRHEDYVSVYTASHYRINFKNIFYDEGGDGWAVNLIPVLGPILFVGFMYDKYRGQPYYLSKIKEALLSNNTELIRKFRHIVQLKEETEKALIQRAREMLSEDEPKRLNEAQTKLLTTSK